MFLQKYALPISTTIAFIAGYNLNTYNNPIVVTEYQDFVGRPGRTTTFNRWTKTLEGPEIYYSNGNISDIIFRKNNVYNGPTIVYDTEGTVKSMINYTNGKKINEYKHNKTDDFIKISKIEKNDIIDNYYTRDTSCVF